MTTPALPPAGSTNWYTHYTWLDTQVRGNTATTIPIGAPTGVAATDTAAIQNAINALPASGGAVRLSAGTYTLNARLLLPSKVTLLGAGMGITILTQTTAGTPVIVSRNWVSATSASAAGSTHIADLTVYGSTGTSAHGIILRDFYSSINNVSIYDCGGHGILITSDNDAAATVSGTLVENHFDNIDVHNCKGWGFYNQSQGAKLTDSRLGRINVDGVASTGGVKIESAAGWSIGHIHAYGTFTGEAVNLSGTWNTWLGSAQIEPGWTGYGLHIPDMQRGLHLGEIAISCNNVAGQEAVHAVKSALDPGEAMTINALTVLQDNAVATTALSWSSASDSLAYVGALNVGGTSKALVTPVAGTADVKVRVGGQLTPNTANVLWDGGGAQSKTFTVTVLGFRSVIGTLLIGSATFNNGAQLVSYTGQLLLSAKDNAAGNAWAAYLTPLGTPAGLSAGPTVTVTGTGDTRTLTVAFTPTSANGFGGSCALVLAPNCA